MPANLTPQYTRAEAAFRRAQTLDEQAACLEEMLRLIPRHKGTEKLQADLRSRLKETREAVELEKRSSRGGRSFRIARQGAGQILVIGAPNSGKSRLVEELTNAHPEVAPYPFTTREPLPAMMSWEDVRAQLIDTPPITDSHFEPYLLDLMRTADAAILCFDGSSDDAPDETVAVLRQFASRKTQLAGGTGFDPADYSIVRIRTLLVMTRGDDLDATVRLDWFREIAAPPFDAIAVDFDRPETFSSLRQRVFSLLNVLRVYTRRPGETQASADPVTLPRGATVEDLAASLHGELAERLKFAKVWSAGGAEGKNVTRDHPLAEGDLVELHV